MTTVDRLSSPRGTFWASTLLLLAAAWGTQIAASGLSDPLTALFTGVVVLAGCAALGWLRPAHVGVTAPQAMMMLGALGMLAGLAVDAHGLGLEVLASLCTSASALGLTTLLRLHLEWLPAMHVGMAVGGLAAIPLLRLARPHCRRQLCARLAQNLACSGWMIVGMSAGTLFAHQLTSFGGPLGVSGMLGSMFAGMVWGMVVSVMLYRSYFHWRDSAGGTDFLSRDR
jgi:hypothetical protein